MRVKYAAIITAAILLFSVMLGGCAQEEGEAHRVSEYYSGLVRVDETAEITAHFNSYDVIFKLKYLMDKSETVTVQEPESIAGIAVTINADGLDLGYEGTTFSAGESTGETLSAVTVMPLLTRAWREGLLLSWSSEKYDRQDCLFTEHRLNVGGKDIEFRTWFLKDTLEPVFAEAYKEDGTLSCSCRFLLTAFE